MTTDDVARMTGEAPQRIQVHGKPAWSWRQFWWTGDEVPSGMLGLVPKEAGGGCNLPDTGSIPIPAELLSKYFLKCGKCGLIVASDTGYIPKKCPRCKQLDWERLDYVLSDKPIKPDGFIFTDEQDAQKACEWWQGQLRLADWDIKVKIVRSEKMGNPDYQASCNPVERHRQALIKLVDHLDYPTDTEWPHDQEQSTVHELLHLYWPRSEHDSSEDIREDQAVDAQAESLVRLRRLAYPEPPWREK